jgi:hypothetical protein
MSNRFVVGPGVDYLAHPIKRVLQRLHAGVAV